MKTREKIGLTIILALLYFFFQNYSFRGVSHTSAGPGATVGDLQKFYAGANEEYFQGRLPETVVINYDETNPSWMASTRQRIDGVFIIRLNPELVPAQRTAYLTMLHEMCHVDHFMGGDPDDHGGIWKTCMLQEDIQGANRRQIIDGYSGR